MPFSGVLPMESSPTWLILIRQARLNPGIPMDVPNQDGTIDEQEITFRNFSLTLDQTQEPDQDRSLDLAGSDFLLGC